MGLTLKELLKCLLRIGKSEIFVSISCFLPNSVDEAIAVYACIRYIVIIPVKRLLGNARTGAKEPRMSQIYIRPWNELFAV